MRLMMPLILLVWLVASSWGLAQEYKEHTLGYNGKQQVVHYYLYLPEEKPDGLFPVLVCIGGIPMEGDKYIHSDTAECTGAPWSQFIQENKIAILGIGFLFIPDDWPTKESYQFPKVWSGKALLEILDLVAKEYPINPQELYFFGISAGAQYAIRFAQMRPDISKAVTAHAAGGFDEPEGYIPTKFLLTVGNLDNEDIKRRDMAKEFTRLAKKKKIDIQLKIIPRLDHRQTELQNQMSGDFLEDVLRQGRTTPHSRSGTPGVRSGYSS